MAGRQKNTEFNYSWPPMATYPFMLLTVILINISFPSPTHSFIPGLKPSFSANPSQCSLSFSTSGLTT